MANEKSFTQAQRDAAARSLEALPDKPDHEHLLSARETIRGLQPLIQAARQKGYSFGEIANAISKVGVCVTIGTLKYALRNSSPDKSKKSISRKSERQKNIESVNQPLTHHKQPSINNSANCASNQSISRYADRPGSKIHHNEFSFEIRPDIENL